MRTTLACLGIGVPVLLIIGSYLGWYSIVHGSSRYNSRLEGDPNPAQIENEMRMNRQRANVPNDKKASETDCIPLMEPDNTIPIPRPFLRPVDGPNLPH